MVAPGEAGTSSCLWGGKDQWLPLGRQGPVVASGETGTSG